MKRDYRKGKIAREVFERTMTALSHPIGKFSLHYS